MYTPTTNSRLPPRAHATYLDAIGDVLDDGRQLLGIHHARSPVHGDGALILQELRQLHCVQRVAFIGVCEEGKHRRREASGLQLQALRHVCAGRERVR